MPSPAYIAVDLGVTLDEVMDWIERRELQALRFEVVRVRADVYEEFRARFLAAQESG